MIKKLCFLSKQSRKNHEHRYRVLLKMHTHRVLGIHINGDFLRWLMSMGVIFDHHIDHFHLLGVIFV